MADLSMSLLETPQLWAHPSLPPALTPGSISLPGTWLSSGPGMERDLIASGEEGLCKA